jgi:EmrB/QacA subfamily drug resistance transporter
MNPHGHHEEDGRGADPRVQRSVLLVSTLSAFVTPFMGSSTNVALPDIGASLGMDAVLLSWVATSFLLSSAIVLLPLGRAADIYGRKKVFLAGSVVYTVFSLLCGLSGTSFMLLAGRAGQGIGAAMMFGTGTAIVTSVFPPGERGKILGINVSAVYVGLSAGPFLGGILTSQLGWRSIFLANVPLGLVMTAFTIWRLKGEWADSAGERFDLPGALLYGISMVAAIIGLTSLPHASGALLATGGVAGLAGFLLLQLRRAHPLLDVRLLITNRVFTFSSLAALLNYSATFGVTFLISLYLQLGQGLDPQSAGTILIAQPVVMALLSPLAGKLSDRVEPRIVASVGMGVTVVGLLLLSFLGQATSLVFVVISLAVLGVGFALFSSPNTNAVMSAVDRKQYGIAAALLGSMRLNGQIVSMVLVALILEAHIGRQQITSALLPEFIASLRIAFLLFVLLCSAGVLASLTRGRLR